MAYIGRQQDGFGVRSRFIYTATSGQTTFTTDDSSNALSYSDGAYVDVYLNGVLLDPADYTATSLTSIVLGSGATASDILEVIVYDVFSVFSGTFTNGITASEATITNGISAGSATVTGDLTVDTNTLFVDASANAVGIGTSSPTGVPTTTLHINGTTNAGIHITDSASGATDSDGVYFSMDNPNLYIQNKEAGFTAFETSGTERMRIDSSGNVGIGVTSPSSYYSDRLVIDGGGGEDGLTFACGNTTGENYIMWADGTTGNEAYRGYVGYNHGSDFMRFGTSGTERMRIDSSGRVFIGNANNDVNPASTGNQANKGATFGGSSDPYLSIARTGNAAVVIGRIDSDGDLILFYGDGSTAGSISTYPGSFVQMASAGNKSGILYGTSAWYSLKNGVLVDNTVDAGASAYRFRDVYSAGGVTTTSDANEKQQIDSLTDTEITAAKAISKLFKTFKWNDSVESKGDNARTHTGHIAQEVQQAMTDAGLDAADYAFWCSNTWWETQTDVPAVAAVAAQDAVYDDDGNIVTEAVEAVEAQDAHTRTDIYDTQADAPAGATERTRLGLRYAELLAFVGAATEQRLTHLETLETRIEALENA